MRSVSVEYKKLSCRRETTRCFVSLNISLSHSRSLNVIGNGTIRKLGYSFLFAFHSNYGCILHHFRDKARYRSRFFHTPLHLTPPLGVFRRILPYRLAWKNWNGVATGYQMVKKFEDMFSRFDRIPACDGRTDGQTDRHLSTA